MPMPKSRPAIPWYPLRTRSAATELPRHATSATAGFDLRQPLLNGRSRASEAVVELGAGSAVTGDSGKNGIGQTETDRHGQEGPPPDEKRPLC